MGHHLLDLLKAHENSPFTQNFGVTGFRSITEGYLGGFRYGFLVLSLSQYLTLCRVWDRPEEGLGRAVQGFAVVSLGILSHF